MPKITVCLPSYNVAGYIGAAIDSVRHQTISDWRLVIADNRSTDGTAEVIRHYQDPRISLVEHPKNIGMVANWKFLVEQVETPYFCVLGADDYFYPSHLERKLELLEKEPNAPFIHSAVELIDSKGNHLRIYREAFASFEPRNPVVKRFFSGNIVNIAGAVIRTDFIRKYAIGFDARYPLLCDWQFFMLLTLLSQGFAFDREPTSVYRLHSASIARQTEGSARWMFEEKQLQLDMLREHASEWQGIVEVKAVRAQLALDLSCWLLRILRARRQSEILAAVWQLAKFPAARELLKQGPSVLCAKAIRSITSRL